MASDVNFVASQRQLNADANQYAGKVATEFFRSKEEAGPIKLTRTELVAILREAWLAGYIEPHDKSPVPYQPLEDTEICYWCEECDHTQDEDKPCESCGNEGVGAALAQHQDR
jgi:hypothetical protein